MKKIVLLTALILRGLAADAQCVSGDCNDGFGTANIRKIGNVRYVGFFKNRQPSGQGYAEYADGTRYDGTWLNGKWQGIGTLTLNDGTILTGAFRDSRYLGNDADLLAEARKNTNATSQNQTTLIAQTGSQMLSENGSQTALQIITQTHPQTFTQVEPQHGAADTDFVETKNDFVEKNEKSTPQATQPTPQYPERKPQVWVISVGVAVYENPKISLRYPQSDALHVVNLFRGPEGGSLDYNHIVVLTNDVATRQNILDSMRQLFNRAAAEDLVIFYFSGHGSKGAFMPYDYNYDTDEQRLAFSDINDMLASCPARKKLVIADACHAGSYNYYLASKSGGSSLFKRPQQEASDAFFRELSKASAGTAFILSSSAEEDSLEVSTLHQSVFTHFILRGLRGEANTNGDEVISVKELFDYIYKNVTRYAHDLGKVQTPVLKGNFDPNMPVAQLRK